ncbi:bromodomain associated domain-containing protein [Ditylenchus destructor]|uniref:Bromodomain associated domain-containing protein n=1 Tax=Ditylenchus destructor TaxID=166010 RepID=A0AAD4MUL3_9BILA|nr:bromodomain associated domain-containing protein [Ditylenchus destructor]
MNRYQVAIGTTSMTSQTYLDQFAIAASRKTVASIMTNISFTHCTESALAIMTSLMIKYFSKMASTCALYTEIGNRSIATLDDALLTFENMGVSITELWDYMTNVEHFPFSKQVSKFPVEPVNRPQQIDVRLTPPRIEDVIEEARERAKREMESELIESSELSDPTFTESTRKTAESFPSYAGLDAESLGFTEDMNSNIILDTHDCLDAQNASMVSVASPVMSNREPISKKPPGKRRGRKPKRKAAPSTIAEGPCTSGKTSGKTRTFHGNPYVDLVNSSGWVSQVEIERFPAMGDLLMTSDSESEEEHMDMQVPFTPLNDDSVLPYEPMSVNPKNGIFDRTKLNGYYGISLDCTKVKVMETANNGFKLRISKIC